MGGGQDADDDRVSYETVNGSSIVSRSREPSTPLITPCAGAGIPQPPSQGVDRVARIARPIHSASAYEFDGNLERAGEIAPGLVRGQSRRPAITCEASAADGRPFAGTFVTQGEARAVT